MRLLRLLLWTLVFAGLLLAADQLLLRLKPRQPALATVRTFWVDLRGRLLHLGERRPQPPAAGQKPARPPAVAPRAPAPSSARPEAAATPAPPASGAPRFLYADEQGNLQFAESLEEIPPRFRSQAQALER